MKTKLKKLYEKPQLLAAAAAVAALALVLIIVLSLASADDGDERIPTDPPFRPSGGQESQTLLENPLAPEDFVYEGDYLTCLSTEAVLGIDVSYWQGDIDWKQVKDAGVRFAMIRLGYRGMTDGYLNEDSFAHVNYTGASQAGVSVGCYFFSQAVTVEEAVAEAEFVLERIAGWELQMPVVYDWEYGGENSRTANMDARTLTDCAKAFCQTIENAGYEAMVYFNEDQSKNLMHLEELTDYRFWLAQYDHTLDYPYRVDMWQYTCTGSVPGIQGDVDVNLFFEYA